MIRPARPRDAAPCAAMVNAWIDATPWHPRVHSAASVARHYAHTVWEDCDVLVAGDPAVGFVAIDDDQDIIALYANPKRKGVGSTLIESAKSKYEHLALWTHQPNTEAQSFYKKHGFTEVTRTDGDNEEGVPDIRYRWDQT